MPRITVTSLFCVSTEEDDRKAEARGTKDLCLQASDTEEMVQVQVESSICMYLVCMRVCFNKTKQFLRQIDTVVPQL